VQRVREALQEHECRPRGSNLKLRARCPLCESSRPDVLSVSQGRCGALVRCFAACETAGVLAAIGLGWDDLFDEPREGAEQAWKPLRREPAPADRVGEVIERAVRVQLTAEAQKGAAWWLLPKLSAAERVEQAEWGCQEDARRHYWRTMARWAALACRHRDVAEAYQAREAWLERGGERPTHEQFMVLMFRAEDLARAPATDRIAPVVPLRPLGRAQ
jgi:hypothetical protein